MADSQLEAQREMREDLVETLGRELLGPFGGPGEVLRQRPTSRYLLGRLAPAGTQVSPEEDEGTADATRGARQRRHGVRIAHFDGHEPLEHWAVLHAWSRDQSAQRDRRVGHLPRGQS